MAAGTAARPQAIQWAVIATAVNAIGGVLFAAFWPDLEDRGTILTVSIVLSLLMLGGAAWLWTGARWGAIATLANHGLNVLLTLPGYFQGDAEFIVGGSISLALSVIAIVLVLRPEARAFWRQ